MRKLTPKDYNENEFNMAINGKSIINADIENIKSRFEDFKNNQYKLEDLSQKYDKPTECKGLENLACDLYKLYDSKSKESIKFREEIQKISEIKCPYCGIDTPSHLDHFLPRAKFPEFSIFAPNLIYVCSICNSKYKGDDIVNTNGERKFFNPYFDDFIETTQFLKCEIKLDGSLYPTFKFYIEDLSATMPYKYTVMKNHFEAMDLQTRYMDQIVKEKFLRFKNRYNHKPVSLEKLKENIDYELGGLNSENVNNWEKVFWESLKNCNECLNLITNKKIS